MERDEHHDILIQQLRAEIYELKKSEEDYYLLQEQLNRLETKYRLLNDEKVRRFPFRSRTTGSISPNMIAIQNSFSRRSMN